MALAAADPEPAMARAAEVQGEDMARAVEDQEDMVQAERPIALAVAMAQVEGQQDIVLAEEPAMVQAADQVEDMVQAQADQVVDMDLEAQVDQEDMVQADQEEAMAQAECRQEVTVLAAHQEEDMALVAGCMEVQEEAMAQAAHQEAAMALAAECMAVQEELMALEDPCMATEAAFMAMASTATEFMATAFMATASTVTEFMVTATAFMATATATATAMEMATAMEVMAMASSREASPPVEEALASLRDLLSPQAAVPRASPLVVPRHLLVNHQEEYPLRLVDYRVPLANLQADCLQVVHRLLRVSLQDLHREDYPQGEDPHRVVLRLLRVSFQDLHPHQDLQLAASLHRVAPQLLRVFLRHQEASPHQVALQLLQVFLHHREASLHRRVRVADLRVSLLQEALLRVGPAAVVD